MFGKRSRWYTLILLILVLALLAACGGKATQAPAATQPAEQPTKAPEKPTQAPEKPKAEKVTLRVWTHQNESFNNAYKALADKYMAEHPNVDIQFETFDYDTYIQTLQTALPAGTEADVLQMFGSWVCSYAEGNNLAEVPADMLTVDKAQGMFFGPPIGGYICDGKLYGVPQEFNIEYGAALVNTKLAQEVGATNYEKGWGSWDDLIEDAKKLTVIEDGAMTRAGFMFTHADGISTMFYSLIRQYGGQYLQDGVFKVTTPEAEKALALMKRFVDEKVIDPVLFNDEENWVGDAFFDQLVGIAVIGPWVIPEYGADYPDVVKVAKYVKLPYEGDKPTFVAASGWGLTVSNNSKVKDVAWDFVQFVTMNADNALQWNLATGTLPALSANTEGTAKEKLVGEFPYFEPFLEILPYGEYEGAFPDRDFVWYEVTYPEVLNFLQGNQTAEETLKNIEQAVQESMK
ncbi:MAG: extracellular solute-binding protein [Chloroflexi bacterium]|nr:extracellular solute-binding protein [Chloroflexota bacterium]